jgi:hypothetical protein
MIQRIQSVFLLLAALSGAGMGYFNLWKAKLMKGATASEVYFNALSSYLIFIVVMVMTLLSLVTIFLYKNRKLQFRLTVINILLAIGAIVLQYFKVGDTAEKLMSEGSTIISATYLPAAFLPVVTLVCLFLAARGIYKDEKLIKSLDRLR